MNRPRGRQPTFGLGDQPEYGVPFRGEGLLVFRAHVVLRLRGVKVQVHGLQAPAVLAEVLKGELEEAAVVRLEVQFPSRGQRPPVAIEEAHVREPALGADLLRPGVGEVQQDAIHFPLGEAGLQPFVRHPGGSGAGPLRDRMEPAARKG